MFFVNGKLDGAGNTFDVTEPSSTRKTGSAAASGNNINDLVQNIYDLEGNYYEWTAEARGNTNRRLRGSYYSLAKPASNRTSDHASQARAYTSRSTLYINPE